MIHVLFIVQLSLTATATVTATLTEADTRLTLLSFVICCLVSDFFGSIIDTTIDTSYTVVKPSVQKVASI